MNNLMQQPQGADMGQQPSAPSPEEIAQSRQDLTAMTKGLMGLAARPKGSLTKQDVFNAAADMIADGAFSTTQAKQALVAELAQMPDDDESIRQVVGQHLMFMAHASERINHHFGPGE